MKNSITTLIILLILLDSYGQSLTNDTLHINEVVVTGTRVEVSRRNVPLTVSVIKEKELEESGESAILPVISEQIPGVFVTERGITGFGVADGAAGQINIRGLGGSPTTQVLVLIDGHPQFMGMMGHPLPDAYVTSDAERVEVIRGPGSILYGSNAMGGVINIVTHKQKQDGIKFNSNIQYGSFNTQKYMASIGVKKDKINVFGSVNYNQTDGHRDTSDFSILNGYFKAGYDLNTAFKITGNFSFANYDANDPGPEDAIAGYQIDILRGESSVSLENSFDFAKGGLNIYYNYGEHKISDGWHSNDENYGIIFYQSFQLQDFYQLEAVQ